MNEEDLLRNHPLLNGMDPQKLQFILSFASKDKPKSMRDAMPFLLANMNAAKKNNIHFTSPEVQLIAQILSRDLPEEDKARIEKMLSVVTKNQPG